MGSGISSTSAFKHKQKPPDNDIQMDVLPINQKDRDLHIEHMGMAAERLGPDSPSSSANLQNHAGRRHQTYHKDMNLEAEQTKGAKRRHSLDTCTEPKQDQEVHPEEPPSVPMSSVGGISTEQKVPVILKKSVPVILEKAVPVILEKEVPVISEKEVPAIFVFLTKEIVDDFLEFFRILVPLSVKPNQEMPNVEAWIQQEKRDNSSKVTEVHYQLLIKWKSHRGGLDDKFFTDIKEALRSAGKNETLAKLEQKFSEYFTHH